MSGTDVARRPAGALAVTDDQTEWTEAQAAALAQMGVEEAPRGDQLVFLGQAQRTGLDPFARQLYMIGRKDRGTVKWTVQASIDGLRVVAQRSGSYRGQVGPQWCGPDGQWSDVWLHQGPPAAARVGVLREGWAQPMYAVAHFAEYAATYTDRSSNSTTLTGQWRSKPSLMLAKCAEALALRKAFPHDLSGIYTSEEMSQADAPQPAAHPAPAAAVDHGPAIAAASTREELNALWRRVVAAGQMSEDVKATFTERAARIAAVEDEQVVDAEVVDPDAQAESEHQGDVEDQGQQDGSEAVAW